MLKLLALAVLLRLHAHHPREAEPPAPRPALVACTE